MTQRASEDGPRRRFRKLRIAWSVGWGLLAILLCALWVSSYWQWQSLRYFVTNDDWFVWCQEDGEMALTVENYPNLPAFIDRQWQFETFPPRSPKSQMPINAHASSFFFYRAADGFTMAMPTWVLVIGVSTLAGLPWLPWRFSLRTMLIATTLVAIMLGLIVYLLHKPPGAAPYVGDIPIDGAP
jgi:hypothetical protein